MIQESKSLKYEPSSEPQYFNKRLHAIGGYNGAKYLSAAGDPMLQL